MKPLLVLIISFLISLLVIKLVYKTYNYPLSARIAMAIMLIFTAVGHFTFTKGMSMMIPKMIPFKENIVYITGVLEILFALGLLIPNLKTTTGWLFVTFLLLMLPANIYASIHQVNYQTGALDGNGLRYLFFRIPLQFFFMGWVYVSSIKF